MQFVQWAIHPSTFSLLITPIHYILRCSRTPQYLNTVTWQCKPPLSIVLNTRLFLVCYGLLGPWCNNPRFFMALFVGEHTYFQNICNDLCLCKVTPTLFTKGGGGVLCWKKGDLKLKNGTGFKWQCLSKQRLSLKLSSLTNFTQKTSKIYPWGDIAEHSGKQRQLQISDSRGRRITEVKLAWATYRDCISRTKNKTNKTHETNMWRQALTTWWNLQMV